MNISEFSTKRRVEILRQLDRRLADMKVVSRGTMWHHTDLKQLRKRRKRTGSESQQMTKSFRKQFCIMLCVRWSRIH